MMTVLERFLNYIKVETTSDESSRTCPSTKGQVVLGQLLVDELKEMGLEDANMDENGYVMATLPSNLEKDVPTIGFISHMDTAPDLRTKNIQPRVVEKYDGGDIVLNKEKNILLSIEDFPEMKVYEGQDLVVTDGLTLLGADDKAGIAEIMTAVSILAGDSSIPHGTIKVGFTPDEEIGRGADKFNVEKFKATYAYTLDGGPVGELEYESFNANNANLIIHGRNVHPGYAKERMINSMEIMMELHAMLPPSEQPQYTSGYEGFFHQIFIKGSVEQTSTAYIIRDHDTDKFEARKKLLVDAVDFINKKYGPGTADLEMKDSYYNMGKMIEPVYEIVEMAKKVMEDLGIEPLVLPIRGGTDGSRLSYMGLPCPNIFAGGHNFHGKHEFVPVQSMEKAVQVVLGIVDGFAKQ